MNWKENQQEYTNIVFLLRLTKTRINCNYLHPYHK